jgi:hypothetical protein
MKPILLCAVFLSLSARADSLSAANSAKRVQLLIDEAGYDSDCVRDANQKLYPQLSALKMLGPNTNKNTGGENVQFVWDAVGTVVDLECQYDSKRRIGADTSQFPPIFSTVSRTPEEVMKKARLFLLAIHENSAPNPRQLPARDLADVYSIVHYAPVKNQLDQSAEDFDARATLQIANTVIQKLGQSPAVFSVSTSR